MQATVHQTIPTVTMVAHLQTAGTRWDQPRDGGVGSETLQVQRGSVGAGPSGFPISVGADADQAGEAVRLRMMSKSSGLNPASIFASTSASAAKAPGVTIHTAAAIF